MRLERLTIINYKNIEQASLTFSPEINCLYGANGMGKTNVLDAIYYMSRLRSAGLTLDEQNVRHGAENFLLKGNYVTEDGTRKDVSCGYQKGHKSVKVNDKAVRRFSEHLGNIPLVMISPSDSQLVSGGSAERRRFLDATLSQHDVSYLEAIMRYDKTLHQRNALLKKSAEHGTPIDSALMDVLENMMEQDAAVIYDRRRAFLNVFVPIFQEVYANLSNVEREEVTINYLSQAERGPLHELFAQGRAKELIVGYSLYGPHKDDLEFQLCGYPLRREGSQGQTKTYSIALKIAQFAYLKNCGRAVTPILLLDDIFDKLDEGRVRKIVSYTTDSSFGQVFITDTSRERMCSLIRLSRREARLFYVSEGTIEGETLETSES
ncbi:MAG: DNA replication and repair protein RecF [Alloprevotella sp.]|nr:DNA replication and repair protein RecF [Alloprevotella sp.]